MQSSNLCFVTVPRDAVIGKEQAAGKKTPARASRLALQWLELIHRAAQASTICTTTEPQTED